MTATVRRVQRVAEQWPLVHLEATVPSWSGLVVDGLVAHPRAFTLADLGALDARDRVVPVHCVWGWSVAGPRWTGVELGALLDVVSVQQPRGSETFVVVSSASGTYSSCLALRDARRGVLAWRRDGEPLAADAGGPLRYVGPEDHWAYKHVKWASRVTVTDTFSPGFWESKLADPVGCIPEGVELP